MDGKTYTIKTLEDILRLDWRQREDFIKDLWVWLEFRDSAAHIVAEFAEQGITILGEGMEWKDDGEAKISGIKWLLEDDK